MKIEDIILLSLVILINLVISFQIVNKEEIKFVQNQIKEAPEIVRERVGVPTIEDTFRKIKEGARDAFN